MLTINRFIHHPTIGTFGELLAPGNKFLCYTCEAVWADNTPNLSCVPQGLYQLVILNDTVYLHNACYMVEGTDEPTKPPIRWGCKVHSANWPHQLKGCVSLGESITSIYGKLGVTNSARTTAKYLPALMGTEYIDIKWSFPDD